MAFNLYQDLIDLMSRDIIMELCTNQQNKTKRLSLLKKIIFSHIIKYKCKWLKSFYNHFPFK